MDPNARVAAANTLLDRAYGKMRQKTARRIIQAHLRSIEYRAKSAGSRKRNGIAFESLVSDFDGRRGARH